MKYRIELLLAGMTLLTACTTTPATNRGPILGMIYNHDRLPVGDVTVSWLQNGKSVTTALSDVRGRFSLPEIPYGKITLQFSKDAYEPVVWNFQFSTPSQVVYMRMENSDELFGEASDAVERQDWASANAVLARVEKLVPHSAITQYLRGVMLAKQGKPADAAALLEELSSETRSTFAVEISLADLYQYKLDDDGRALAHLRRALAIRRDLDVEKRVMALTEKTQ